MKNRNALLTGLVLLAIGGWPAAATADMAEKLKAAMASDIRTEAEVARDENRRPLETLTFFGLTDEMRVLELLPGGGWYTKLLAPVLAEKGQLYVSIGTTNVQKLIDDGVLSDVEVVEAKGEFKRAEDSRRFYIEGLTMDVKDLDMVLTFRNLHNFTEQGRRDLNAAAFKALKSGGIYGVVDHTRRHMQEDYSEVWRRMDPVQMIKEIQAAGFEFVDYSPLHYRPDDTLEYEVGRKTVTGNTDRFTLLFRKP
ncbi:MAG: class I SAM-dependent methyltransferase [Pseudomonadales bacterium]